MTFALRSVTLFLVLFSYSTGAASFLSSWRGPWAKEADVLPPPVVASSAAASEKNFMSKIVEKVTGAAPTVSVRPAAEKKDDFMDDGEDLELGLSTEERKKWCRKRTTGLGATIAKPLRALGSGFVAMCDSVEKFIVEEDAKGR